MRLPITLRTLAARETYGVTLFFPILRHSAAPASYTAMNGRDNVVMSEYVSRLRFDPAEQKPQQLSLKKHDPYRHAREITAEIVDS